MKRRRFFCLFFLFFAFLFAGKAVAGSILVQPLACISKSSVTLRELAVSDIPEDLWRQIADIPLFPAPKKEGSKERISRKEMQQYLEKQLGPEVAELCTVPSQILIQRGGLFWDQAALRQKIDSFLTPKVAGLSGEIVFRDFQIPTWIFSDKDGRDIKVELARNLAPGRIALRLELQDATGKGIRRFSGSVFMDRWIDVPCALHPIRKGDKVNISTDVQFLRKNEAYLRESVWDGKGGVWRTTRSVGTNQPFYLSSLEPLPVISKGSRCVLRFSGKYIALEVPAIALQDGGIGQTVLVRNLQSKKTVAGRVLSPGVVLVGSD